MAGKIFINYRRGADAGYSGRLFDRLLGVFPQQQLFMDVDNIAPGLDFVRVLNERVAECDVVLAVIGKGWLDARDASGKRRLDDPDDFVRIEIASALNQDKRVIPVLVNDASMPRPEELPEVLRPLARRNAVRLTHERFRSDADGLIKALQQSFDEIESERHEAEAARRAAQQQGKGEAEGPRRGRRPPAALVASGLLAVVAIAAASYWFAIGPPPPAVTPLAPAVPAAPAAAPAASLPSATPAPAPPLPSPDQAAWALLKDTTDEAALKRFVAQYPSSPLRQDAEARMAALEAALAAAAQAKPPPLPPDQIAWAIVKDSKDPDQLRRFVAEFPDSSARAEAEKRIAALAAEEAQAAAEAASNAQELTRALQFELVRVGCLTGNVNGQFDDATKAAWHNFTKLTSLNLPDEVSAEALKAIRGVNKRVCPLQCAAGQHAEGDQCVANPPPAPQRAESAPAKPPARPANNPAARGSGRRCFSFQGQQFCE